MRIRLTRYTEAELESAVAEKLKEGWILVHKGPEHREFHTSTYHNSRKHNKVYAGVQTYGKWIAVMKKEDRNGASEALDKE